MRRGQLEFAPSGSAWTPRRGENIVIVSGKGGVGKTVCALNLGVQLAQRGLRVILVDADVGLANADILLNVSPPGDVWDLLDTTRSVEELLVEGPEGLRVLCGVSALTRDGELTRVDPLACVRALRRLNRAYDTMLIDCGAGVTPAVVAFALAGDRLILVTTPEPTALADGYATLKMLHHSGTRGRMGVVVNLARSRAEACEAARRLQRVARQFLGLSLEYLGSIPPDRHVVKAVHRRWPVALCYPRSAASTCLRAISQRIAPQQTAAPSPGGLWARVAGLFL